MEHTYEILVRGHLDDSWSEWFDGLEITPCPNGATRLSGVPDDQAILHGALAKIRNLNLLVISVTLVETHSV